MSTRSTLKGYFKQGAIPTEIQFADFIDSTLNFDDDTILKFPNNPLSIKASGADETLLNFYRVEQDGNKLSWQLKQKPDGKSGLSIGSADSAGAVASRLFIDGATGNLGVGTTDPSMDNVTRTLAVGRGVGGIYGIAQMEGQNPWRASLVTEGKERLSILDVGNVGIGTTSPKSRLAVAGGMAIGSTYAGANASPDNGLLVEGNVSVGTTDTKAAKLVVDTMGGSGKSLWLEHRGSNFIVRPLNDGANSSIIENTGGGALLINPGSGNVGIGTVTPQGNLQIVGPRSFDSSTILHITNGATDYGRTNLVLTGRLNAGNDDWHFGSAARNSLVFSFNQKAANVDVGVIGDEIFSIQLEGNSNSLGFLTKKLKTSPALVIQQDGNVGIGTTKPSQKLDVIGTLKTDILRLGNKWCFSGVGDFFTDDKWLRMQNIDKTAYFGGFAADELWTNKGSLSGSDERLKKDIKTLANALEKVVSLRGVSFKWKNAEANTSSQIGLIAQEVETLFPELVENGPDGMKGVNYSGFIAILIEALKEQQAQINELRAAVKI